MLLNRICKPHVLRHQAGVQKSRSFAEHIHLLRKIVKCAWNKNLPLIVTFVDRHYSVSSNAVPKIIADVINVIYKGTSLKGPGTSLGQMRTSSSSLSELPIMVSAPEAGDNTLPVIYWPNIPPMFCSDFNTDRTTKKNLLNFEQPGEKP